MKGVLAFAIVFAFLASPAFAAYANAFEPVQEKILAGQTVSLGRAGPGQTLILVVDRGTDGGTCPADFCTMGWDQLKLVDAPEGWTWEDSPIHESPMKAKVKISPNAADGEYNLTFATVDEGNYDGLNNMTFYATVVVTRDVFEISVSPVKVETGVGQPAVYNIKIVNTGVASDPFEIRVREGDLPAWEFKKQVLVNYGSERVVPYEVVLDEEYEKEFTLEVSSLSSPLIQKQMKLTVESKSSIINDWKATTHGLIIFPIFLEPAYAIMGLLASFL